jgi:uncharacterized protein (TIGR02246 family)
MRLPQSFLIFLMLLVACASEVAAQNDAAQEVRKLERAWLDAYEQHDSKAMDRIVADDFTITFTDGRIQTKPQIMKSIAAPRNPNNPPSRFYTEDVQARVYNDTVILIGLVTSQWQQNGQPMKEQNRYTDTYVKRNGRWQVVASHLSNAPKPKKQTPPVLSNSGDGGSAH